MTHQCEPLTNDFAFDLGVFYNDANGTTWSAFVDVAYETVVTTLDGQIIGEYSGSGINWQFQITFPQLGTYNIKTHYTYIDFCSGAFIESDSEFQKDVLGSCTRHNMSASARHELNGKRITCELWSKWDIFGEHQVATTQSEEWKNPWLLPEGWYDEDANVTASIHWDFVDDYCEDALVFTEGSDEGDETDQCGSCDFKRAGMTNACDGNLSIQDDAVHSYHRLANEGTVFEVYLVLSTCD